MKRNDKSLSIKGLWVIVLMIGAMMVRVLPHPPNVSPMTAICLFSGFAVGVRLLSFLIPILVIYCSDFVINNTISKTFIADSSEIIWWSDFMWWTYASYALIIIIGAMSFEKIKTKNIIRTAIISSLIFFLLTNFGSWISYSFYPKNGTGLLMCYQAGVPFFRTSLLSDIGFSIVLFGAYKFITTPKIDTSQLLDSVLIKSKDTVS